MRRERRQAGERPCGLGQPEYAWRAQDETRHEFAWAVAEQRRCPVAIGGDFNLEKTVATLELSKSVPAGSWHAVDYEMTARRKKARKKQIDLLFLLTHPSCNARLVMVGRCEALDPAGPFRKDNPGTPEEWFDHDALLVQLELEPVTLAEFVRGLVTALIDAAILSKPGRRDAAEPCSSLLDSGVCDDQSCQKQHALPFWEDEKVLLASEGGGEHVIAPKECKGCKVLGEHLGWKSMHRCPECLEYSHQACWHDECASCGLWVCLVCSQQAHVCCDCTSDAPCLLRLDGHHWTTRPTNVS
jgi:hypothetical protein